MCGRLISGPLRAPLHEQFRLRGALQTFQAVAVIVVSLDADSCIKAKVAVPSSPPVLRLINWNRVSAPTDKR